MFVILKVNFSIDRVIQKIEDRVQKINASVYFVTKLFLAPTFEIVGFSFFVINKSTKLETRKKLHASFGYIAFSLVCQSQVVHLHVDLMQNMFS